MEQNNEMKFDLVWICFVNHLSKLSHVNGYLYPYFWIPGHHIQPKRNNMLSSRPAILDASTSHSHSKYASPDSISFLAICRRWPNLPPTWLCVLLTIYIVTKMQTAEIGALVLDWHGGRTERFVTWSYPCAVSFVTIGMTTYFMHLFYMKTCTDPTVRHLKLNFLFLQDTH